MDHLLPPITIITDDSFHKFSRIKISYYKLAYISSPSRHLMSTFTNTTNKVEKQSHLMEQTLIYTNSTQPMSTYHSNPSPLVQNHNILMNEPSSEQKGSSFPSKNRCPRLDFIPNGSELSFIIGNDDEDDVDDEESEFKMGRLIRQASLNSSQMSSPQQATKVMTGSSSLPRCFMSEAKEEKVMNMRKVESMKERSNGNKSCCRSMKMGRKNGGAGAPLIPGGWVDKGSSEDMKAQIKFWARAVAYNLHQEC